MNETSNLLEKSRIAWLDVFKGIGIILVVFGHVYVNNIASNWIYSFHMPLFFFATGYTYKKRGIKSDIIRKAKLLLIPYFSFGIIELIYWQLLERRFRHSSLSFCKAFLGLVRASYDMLDFNVHLWFLPCMFICCVIFNILINKVGKKYTYITIFALSALFIILPFPIDGWPSWYNQTDSFFDWPGLPVLPWGINRVCTFIAFFAVGNICNENGLMIWLKDRMLSFQGRLMMFIITLLCLVASIFCSLSQIYQNGIMWFFTALFGIYITLVVALLLENFKILSYLGRNTLVILCTHGPVYRVWIKIISLYLKLMQENIRTDFFLTFIIVVFTLVTCIAINGILIEISPWMCGKIRKF